MPRERTTLASAHSVLRGARSFISEWQIWKQDRAPSSSLAPEAGRYSEDFMAAKPALEQVTKDMKEKGYTFVRRPNAETREKWGHIGESYIHDEAKFVSRYYFHPGQKILRGAIYFTRLCEGPPKCAHGGSISACIDDILGATVWLSGHKAVTGSLTISFKKFVALNSAVQFTAFVENVEGRKINARCTLSSSDGRVVHAVGTAMFIAIDWEKYKAEQAARQRARL